MGISAFAENPLTTEVMARMGDGRRGEVESVIRERTVDRNGSQRSVHDASMARGDAKTASAVNAAFDEPPRRAGESITDIDERRALELVRQLPRQILIEPI
jgi:division protein CdvB (Snf7/Vps24/ESCRT-III family)